MKKEFAENGKADFQIRITEMGTGKKIFLKAKDVRDIGRNEEGKAVILYRLYDRAHLKEIVTQEDGDAVLRLLNGDPDLETEVDLKQEVILERQQEFAQTLEKFVQDSEAKGRRIEQEYQEEHKALQAKINFIKQDTSQTKKIMMLSFRTRWACLLNQRFEQREEEKEYTHEHYNISRAEKLERLAYRLLTMGTVGETIDLYRKNREILKRDKEEIQDMVEGHKRFKHLQEQAFDREVVSLKRLRDNPNLSQEDRGRLEVKIDGYRLEHGDRHNFHFKEQPNGRFENVQTPERKIEKTVVRRTGRQRPSRGRSISRGRSPSRGREM